MRCVLQKKIFFLDYADEGRMRLRLNSGNRSMALVVWVGPLFCRDSLNKSIVLSSDKLLHTY